jgi:ubiquinone biosynthesis protein
MTLLAIPVVGVFTALTVLVFAVGARRLLGLRFSLVRTLVAGLIAFLLAQPIVKAIGGTAVTGKPNHAYVLPGLWFLLLGAVIALVVGMVFLVVAEALVPSGSLPGPLYVVRGSRKRIHRIRRYSQIGRIMLRHGLAPYLRGGRRAELATSDGRAQLARSLRGALDDGGVTFVKLGQVLSTRRDLLPTEFVDELSHLQDHAAQLPWAEVEQVLRTELGAEEETAFATIDHTPIAAASVAQVHAATLKSGEQVVVKVLRPGVRRVVEWDLDILARLARTLQRNTRWGRGIGTVELARGFAEALREELDLRIEVGNMQAIAAASAARNDRSDVRIPVPHELLCTEQVLVMQRLAGLPITAGCLTTCWPEHCWKACCAKSWWTASSTPTHTPATSCCSPTASSGCSTSARSPASTPDCVRRCSGCCSPSTGGTRSD